MPETQQAQLLYTGALQNALSHAQFEASQSPKHEQLFAH